MQFPQYLTTPSTILIHFWECKFLSYFPDTFLRMSDFKSSWHFTYFFSICIVLINSLSFNLRIILRTEEWTQWSYWPSVFLSPRVAVSQQLEDHKTEQVFMIKSLSLKFLWSAGHLTGTRRSNSDLIQTES